MTPASRRWGACLVGQFHDMVGAELKPFLGKTRLRSLLTAPAAARPKRSGCTSNNGSKSDPASLQISSATGRGSVYRTTGNDALRIYTTTTPTTHRLYTLMHDPIYRMSVATENVAYNQPPEPGIYIGPT